MVPILARYGPFFLYSYTVAVSLGLLVALGLIALRTRARPFPGWLDAVLVSLVGAIFGGRLVYVWVSWQYFRLHPGESWQLWQGGLAYHGCLLGALLALFLWSFRQGRSFLAYADLFAPAGALLAIAGWAACWLEGCAYGRETVIGAFAAALPDAFGVVAVRYQTQVFGIVTAVAVSIAAWVLRDRLYRGQLFWLTLALLSFSRAAIGTWRGDLAAVAGPLNAVVAVDLLIGVVAAGGLILVTIKAKTATAA